MHTHEEFREEVEKIIEGEFLALGYGIAKWDDKALPIVNRLISLFQSHEEEKWKHIPTHPCLCSICLNTRNEQVKQVKQELFKKVEGLIVDEELRGRFDKGTPRWNDDLVRNNLRAELRSSLKALEEQEI